MSDTVKSLFTLEKKPLRGLTLLEWVVVAYMLFTLVVFIVLRAELPNPADILLGRARVLLVMMALWGVYRLAPCRITMAIRTVAQMTLLAWWYPDTYEFNRIFPNLDHLFASWEQTLFGGQPALAFAAAHSSPVVSEMMSFGYAAYYPMIAVVSFYYFFKRYGEFQRCTALIMAAFFIYYIVYLFLPVVGPTFYYKAIGIDSVAKGVFPSIGDYFNFHQDCLPTPGYSDGFFYSLVEGAKAAGERPTAAFPSSHVGIATVLMLLCLRSRCRSLTFTMLPVYILLCLSTVYIQAHYVIDTIAGLLTGALLYFLLFAILFYKKEPQRHKKRLRGQ